MTYWIIALLLLSTTYTVNAQNEADSLNHYMELAARNNSQLKSEFSVYKASMEKVPQAGAYSDPELSMDLYLSPMESFGGKQTANISIMQMFPWFGSRSAARSEATEMARMSYEKFREARNNIYFEVKRQWYQLSNLYDQLRNTKANIALLDQLERLSVNRFSAASIQGVGKVSSSPAKVASASSPPASGGMSGMGGGMSATASAPTSASKGMGGMGGMGDSGMGSSKGMGGMSDILRIQLEKTELEDKLLSILSNIKSAEAQFNALLSRPHSTTVVVPDSLMQRVYLMDEKATFDSIANNNPMLTMLVAESNSFRAKAKMDRKMSYPMFGVGVEYTIMGKSQSPMVMPSMNGKDMIMPMFKITLPLFRGKYSAQQRESKYYREASNFKYTNTLNQLEAQYIEAKQQMDDAARKIELYTRQYELSISTFRMMTREFSAGSASLTDVIQIERQMLDYRFKKSEAVATYNTAVASIERLTSTSF